MAIYINTLNGGSITIGTGGGVLDPTKTRFTLQDGTVETYDITGTIDLQWMIVNGYFDENELAWSKTITQADIGNTVTSIGGDVFHGCRGLTSVTISAGVTLIGEMAFESCSGLASVTIPDSVTSIGNQAFYDFSGLTSVTMPDSVTSIGGYAFSDCSGLTSVTITANGGNAASVKQKMIDAGVSPSVTWNMPEPTYHADTWYKYPGDTDWRTVSISGSINSSEDVGIPTTQIPDVGRVAALEIGTDVTSIGSFAFVECNLTNVTIPDSVTSIGSVAFGSCNGLTSITVLGKTTVQAQTLLADASVPEGCTIVGELG